MSSLIAAGFYFEVHEDWSWKSRSQRTNQKGKAGTSFCRTHQSVGGPSSLGSWFHCLGKVVTIAVPWNYPSSRRHYLPMLTVALATLSTALPPRCPPGQVPTVPMYVLCGHGWGPPALDMTATQQAASRHTSPSANSIPFSILELRR